MLHMCTCITCPTLMQIIDKRSDRVQPMDNVSLLHMPHHTSPSPQYIGAHCQVNVCTSSPRKSDRKCIKKSLVRPWKKRRPTNFVPQQKACAMLNQTFFFVWKKRFDNVYDVLNPNFCTNVSQPTMIPKRKKTLKWRIIFCHIRRHERNFSETEKSAPSFRNDLEKIHIEVPHKINDFALKV